MDILVSSDKNYLKYLKVLIASVYENHTPETPITFYVLHNSLQPEDETGVHEFARRNGQEVHFVWVDESKYGRLFERFSFSRWAMPTMFRLFAHELLPQTLDRVLYLDLDIVCNGDLSQFYALDFEDCFLIATREIFDAKNEPQKEFERFERLKDCSREKLANPGIFNAGVLLMNLKKFRQEHIDVQFYLHAIGEDTVPFLDQSILNLSFAEQTKLLTTCKYNYRIAHSARNFYNRANHTATDKVKYTFYPVDAKVIHYCGRTPGKIKPWDIAFNEGEIASYESDFLNLIPECASYFKIWWKYAALTPDYAALYQNMCMNKAAYKMIKLITSERKLEFCNQLGLESYFVPVWQDRNTIGKNDDLNDFTKPRVFRCVDGQTKETIKNLPEDFIERCGFRLAVKHIAANGAGENATATLQILEPNVPEATVYRRYCANPGKRRWSKWYRMATTQDIPDRRDVEGLEQRIRILEQTLLAEGAKDEAELRKKRRCAEADLMCMQRSVLFRLGRAMTWLPRKVRDCVRKGI